MASFETIKKVIYGKNVIVDRNTKLKFENIKLNTRKLYIKLETVVFYHIEKLGIDVEEYDVEPRNSVDAKGRDEKVVYLVHVTIKKADDKAYKKTISILTKKFGGELMKSMSGAHSGNNGKYDVYVIVK